MSEHENFFLMQTNTDELVQTPEELATMEEAKQRRRDELRASGFTADEIDRWIRYNFEDGALTTVEAQVDRYYLQGKFQAIGDIPEQRARAERVEEMRRKLDDVLAQQFDNNRDRVIAVCEVLEQYMSGYRLYVDGTEYFKTHR